VKVDAGGLKPGGTWYYRFELSGPEGQRVQSPIGRTRTLPVGADPEPRTAEDELAA
jgi:phosphodiesterase/alkaline phosphatase D-like protein